jgi:hypothetical protein
LSEEAGSLSAEAGRGGDAIESGFSVWIALISGELVKAGCLAIVFC